MQLPDHSERHRIFSKKAFEIGYALFRIAAHVNRRSFAEHLEEHGLRLLGSTTAKNYDEARQAISGIEYFMILASDATLVKPDICNFVIDEIKRLNSAIAEFEKLSTLPDIDISGVFSPIPPISRANSLSSQVKSDIRQSIEEVGEGDLQSETKLEGETEPHDRTMDVDPSHSGFGIRQSAIISKIRQSGSCRMKDIQEMFPDTSERTLRYDLQTLVERGDVERVGSSGPATYYRVRSS